MAIVYLGLGSNMGDKHRNLIAAKEILEERVGSMLALSSFYETEPWGFKSDNMFINAVIKLQTTLTPNELLSATKQIEIDLGRTGKTVTAYQDRVIDVDILLYNDMVMKSENLTIPHPLMHERDFVMRPLAEIAPDLEHPIFKVSIKELNERL